MASFDQIIDRVLLHETGGDPLGGYVFHPNDPGGETKWGISKRAYPHLDIKNLSRQQALEIYRNDYYFALGLQNLQYTRTAYILMDFAVNAGAKRSARMAQRTLNRFGFGLKVDGKIGPKTLRALDSLTPMGFVHSFNDFRVKFYVTLVRRNPSLMPFLLGWMRRVLDDGEGMI